MHVFVSLQIVPNVECWYVLSLFEYCQHENKSGFHRFCFSNWNPFHLHESYAEFHIAFGLACEAREMFYLSIRTDVAHNISAQFCIYHQIAFVHTFSCMNANCAAGSNFWTRIFVCVRKRVRGCSYSIWNKTHF